MMAALAQTRRALAIARKDIRIYYAKRPVVIFGVLFPVFLFLSFTINRDLSAEFAVPGLLGMILFFTATAVSPIVVPWEAQARTLERLMTCPVRIETIIRGDILASFAFGLGISVVLIIIGLALGVSIGIPAVLGLAMVLAAFCFASLGQVFSIPPTNLPATVNMIASVVKFPVVFIKRRVRFARRTAWMGAGVAYISPLTYFTDIARHSMQDEGQLPVGIDILALVGFTAVFLIAALKFHSRTMPRRI